MKYSTTSLLLGTVLTTFVFSDAEDAGNRTQYLEFGRRGVVNCAFEEDYFFIAWFNSANTEEEPLLIMQNSVKSGRGYFSGEFDMYPNGSLIINKVNFQHDHPFVIVTLKQLTSVATMTVFHVVVTVPPDPPYPVVEGCGKDQYCVLEVGREGVVTCSLKGIRPEVKLEFTTFQAGSIDFWNQQLNVKEHNGTFDISLTSSFTVNLPLFNRVTVECHALSYELSTKFDFLSNNVPPDPLYPVVEGCRNDQYCVLGVGREGVVTCSLRRIRPHVELRFTTSQADSIEFWDQLLSVEAVEHNGTVTFDIRLTSRFTINVPLLNRVTVQCHTSGYEFSTWFDLLYNTDPSSTTHDGEVSMPPTTYSHQNPTSGSSLLPVLIGTTLAATILIVTIVGIVYNNARPGSKMENLQNL